MESPSTSSTHRNIYSLGLFNAYYNDSKIRPFMPEDSATPSNVDQKVSVIRKTRLNVLFHFHRWKDLDASCDYRQFMTLNFLRISLEAQELPENDPLFLGIPKKEFAASEVSPAILHQMIGQIEERDLIACWECMAASIREHGLCEEAKMPPSRCKASEIRNWMNENQNILDQIHSLDLSFLGLSTLPPEIYRLTHLQRLIARSNHIVFLSSDIGKLTNLKRLDLEWNCLRSLPIELWNLTNLKILRVPFNQIEELSSGIGQLQQLEEFDIRDNRLTTLPEAALNKLRHLKVCLTDGVRWNADGALP